MNIVVLLVAAVLAAPSPSPSPEENAGLERELAAETREVSALRSRNAALLAEKRNFETALAQQKDLLAGGDGKAVQNDPSSSRNGVAKPKSVAVWNFNEPTFRIPGSSSHFASVEALPEGGAMLVIDYPEVQEKTNPVVLIHVDPALVAGKTLKFTVLARGEGISKPARAHHGAVFSLRLKQPDGSLLWPGKSLGGGNFDWTEVSFVETIPVGGSFAVMLGLQGVTGKVCFRELKIEELPAE